MQVAATVALLSMVLVVVYMHSVIADLHAEQEEIRSQIAKLSSGAGGSTSGPTGSNAIPGVVAVPDSRRTDPSEKKSWVNWLVPRPRSRHFVPGSPQDPNNVGRRMQILTTGKVAGVACYEMFNSGTQSLDVSVQSCSDSVGNPLWCPACFTTPATVSQNIAVTVYNCKSAYWVRSQTRSGIWKYQFINRHDTYSITVTDNSGSGKTYTVGPGQFVEAYCGDSSSSSTDNRLVWPSYTRPTMVVTAGAVLTSGNFDASSSTGTFATTTGTNTLSGNAVVSGTKTFATGAGTMSIKGATTVADSTTFTVGSAGNGGATTMYGNVRIGNSGSGQAATMTTYGDFTQTDSGGDKKFKTGTGVISINGDINVRSGKNLKMITWGNGVFQTGTGPVRFYGDVEVKTTKTFTSGTGAVKLKGATTVAQNTAFTVGVAGSGGTSTFYGDVVVGGSSNGQAASVTMYGDFAQNDAGSARTFTTGAGTISLKGSTTVAADKNLHMDSSGSGTFQTGTGDGTFFGNTVISGSNTFETGTGIVSLKGTTQVADDKTFSVGSPGSASDSQLFGGATVGGSAAGNSATLVVYGDTTVYADGGGTAHTIIAQSTNPDSFTLNSGFIFSGDFAMTTSSGASTFITGTGPLTLNGDVTITGTKTLIPGSGSSAAMMCNNFINASGATFCKASR